jgi:hypothetical protein
MLLLLLFLLFNVVDVCLIFQSWLWLELTCLSAAFVRSLDTHLMLEWRLIMLLLSSRFWLAEVKGLRFSWVPIFKLTVLKVNDLIVVNLLETRNFITSICWLMVLCIFVLQSLSFLLTVFVEILEVFHSGRKGCTLQQLCSTSLLLSFASSYDLMRLICSLWNLASMKISVPFVVIFHIFLWFIIGNREVEWLRNCFGFLCGFWSFIGFVIRCWWYWNRMEDVFLKWSLLFRYLIYDWRDFGDLFTELAFVGHCKFFIQ